MKNKCESSYEDFKWDCVTISIKDTWENKYLAKPRNPECNSCDDFNLCAALVISKTITNVRDAIEKKRVQ